MPTNTTIAIFLVLLALMLFFFVGQMLSLNDMKTAGTGHGSFSGVFAVILALLVWGLLAALLIMAGVKGEMPTWAAFVAFILHPASFAAVIAATGLMEKGQAAKPWVMVVPAAAPLLMAAYASWAFFPALRAAIPAVAAGSMAWGVVLVLTILPWPSATQQWRENGARLAQIDLEARAAEKARVEAARQENLVKLQAMDPDTPLWRWLEFTDPKKGVREEAFAAIRNVGRRQADAEEMASRGMTGPLLDLPNLGLEATPVLVKAHKEHLLWLVRDVKRPDAASVSYSWIAREVDEYLPSIQWMAERHCGCSGEVAALEEAVRSYRTSPGKADCLEALDKALAAEKK
jgi:hypothetical protein